MDEFIAPRQATVDAGELTDFEESELTGERARLGNVAQRLSGYAKRGTLKGTAFEARGVINDAVRAHARGLEDQRDGVGRRAAYGTSWQLTQYGSAATARQGEERS